MTSPTTSSTAAQTTVTASPGAGYYSGGAMAGLAIGIALPLLLAVVVLILLLKKEKRRFSKPKLMYKLPDDVKEDYSFNPPPPVASVAPAFASNRSSHASGATSGVTSRRGSLGTLKTLGTLASSRPAVSQQFPSSHSQTFLERYEAMKRSAQVQSMEASIVGSRHELDSTGAPTPPLENPRYELSDTRQSQ